MARIAFLIPDMGGGGAERVALSLIQGFVTRGHEVDLLLMERRGELVDLVPPAVQIIDLKSSRLRSAIVPLVRYLRKARPDAMQVSMWPLTIVGILAGLLARTGTRVVTSDHANLSCQYAASPQTLRSIRLTTPLFYPRAQAVVAVSDGVADDLSAVSGLQRGAVKVIHNPVPAISADPTAEREADPVWNGADYRILAVGSLKPEKNFGLFLDALGRLNPRLKWHAVILGEGDQRATLERCARALGIGERVSMPGFTLYPGPYYRTADLFVLSSNYEGFGNVIVEAMSAGLPVVSTDCPDGPSEILDGGAYGRLVACGDAVALAAAMERALAEPIDRAAQIARAATFKPAVATDSYLSLLLGDDA